LKHKEFMKIGAVKLIIDPEGLDDQFINVADPSVEIHCTEWSITRESGCLANLHMVVFVDDGPIVPGDDETRFEDIVVELASVEMKKEESETHELDAANYHLANAVKKITGDINKKTPHTPNLKKKIMDQFNDAAERDKRGMFAAFDPKKHVYEEKPAGTPWIKDKTHRVMKAGDKPNGGSFPLDVVPMAIVDYELAAKCVNLVGGVVEKHVIPAFNDIAQAFKKEVDHVNEKKTTFGELPVGHEFTLEEGGLFMKVKLSSLNRNAVVLKPLVNQHPIPAYQDTFFNEISEIIDLGPIHE